MLQHLDARAVSLAILRGPCIVTATIQAIPGLPGQAGTRMSQRVCMLLK